MADLDAVPEALLEERIAHAEARKRVAELELQVLLLQQQLRRGQASKHTPAKQGATVPAGPPQSEPDSRSQLQQREDPSTHAGDGPGRGSGGLLTSGEAASDEQAPPFKRQRTSQAAALTATLHQDGNGGSDVKGGSLRRKGSGAAQVGEEGQREAAAADAGAARGGHPAALRAGPDILDSRRANLQPAAGPLASGPASQPLAATVAPAGSSLQPAGAPSPPEGAVLPRLQPPQQQGPEATPTSVQPYQDSSPERVPPQPPSPVQPGLSHDPPSPTPGPRHLAELQTLLDQHFPSSSSTSPAPTPLDLGGRTLADDPQHPLPRGLLRLPPGTHLRNGKLEGCCVIVEGGAGEAVRLEQVHIIGTPGQIPAEGQAAQLEDHKYLDAAVVVVQGAGSTAVLTACNVQASEGSKIRTDCVQAWQGGRVELEDCALTGAPHAGLSAISSGSYAAAVRTEASYNGYAGFLVGCSGKMKLLGCTSSLNGVPPGPQAPTSGADFRDAAHTVGHGYVAVSGGQLHVRGGCKACVNHSNGFMANGAETVLTTGRACTATRNGDAGFLAVAGGHLQADRECKSLKNEAGFSARGADSCLVAGDGCLAEDNRDAGFLARAQAVLEVGTGCIAKRNDDGFANRSTALQVVVGERCLAEANRGRGFFMCGQRDGMLIGSGCRALANGAEGFLVAGGRMYLGRDCTAEANITDGFAANSCGRLFVEGGCCVSTGNGKHGFHSAGWTSVVEVGPECRAVQNKGSGFAASLQGDLRLSHGACADRNVGWGLLATGSRGPRLSVVKGYIAEGNAKGSVQTEYNGTFYEVDGDKDLPCRRQVVPRDTW